MYKLKKKRLQHPVYVRIYKSANNDICANLHALPRDATRPRGRIVFTFVREPLEHFESGYSEIVQRSGHQRYDKEYRDPSTLYTFTRYAVRAHQPGESLRARPVGRPATPRCPRRR